MYQLMRDGKTIGIKHVSLDKARHAKERYIGERVRLEGDRVQADCISRGMNINTIEAEDLARVRLRNSVQIIVGDDV